VSEKITSYVAMT